MPMLRALEVHSPISNIVTSDVTSLHAPSEALQKSQQLSIILLSARENISQQGIKRHNMTQEEKEERIKQFWASDPDKGRMYEHYVGYIFEKSGYRVEYFGRRQGNKDMGRDLICQKGHNTMIVQCKYHDSAKGTESVKCIYQLFGTCREYSLDHPDQIVIGALYTTGKVAITAQSSAAKLGILFKAEHTLKIFPRIRCLHNKRIYYLPTDKDYDMIETNLAAGDCYCKTIDEAERKGFTWAHQV